MREYEIARTTAETDIWLKLNLDGNGKGEIDTGVPFLNHMLTLFAKHSSFDLDVKCAGDTDVDYHHSVEDIGICLGIAFKHCLGDHRGLNRYGSIILPMDETLVLCAVDLSSRAYLGYDIDIPTQKVGDFDTELVEEFMRAFTNNAEINLHLKKLDGTNSHHIIEGTFKALARALRTATAIDREHPDEIPSTKGTL